MSYVLHGSLAPFDLDYRRISRLHLLKSTSMTTLEFQNWDVFFSDKHRRIAAVRPLDRTGFFVYYKPLATWRRAVKTVWFWRDTSACHFIYHRHSYRFEVYRSTFWWRPRARITREMGCGERYAQVGGRAVVGERSDRRGTAGGGDPHSYIGVTSKRPQTRRRVHCRGQKCWFD